MQDTHVNKSLIGPHHPAIHIGEAIKIHHTCNASIYSLFSSISYCILFLTSAATNNSHFIFSILSAVVQFLCLPHKSMKAPVDDRFRAVGLLAFHHQLAIVLYTFPSPHTIHICTAHVLLTMALGIACSLTLLHASHHHA